MCDDLHHRLGLWEDAVEGSITIEEKIVTSFTSDVDVTQENWNTES
ncbi:10095_t:CDS:2 [Rhizophagus irregularis]|nr:10095_t:CDS:2 [Rhizophagus irregularis]